jgi:cardiolipin synthase
MKTLSLATLAVAVAIGCGSTNTEPGATTGHGSSSGGGSGSSSGGSGSSSGGSGSGAGGSGGSSGSSSGSGSGSSSGGDDAGSSGSSSGSGSGGVVSSTGVSILVYPNGHHASELIAAINGATTSVYMTIYEIDDTGVINAIVAKKKAGLDVQVILDGSTTTRSNNTSAYSSFNSAGIPVVWSASNFTFTHEKCVMIDHKQAWIMTANAESSVPQYNREYLAIDDNQADVAEAEAIFTADHAVKSITPTGNLVVANSNARPDLVALINSATKSLDIEDEEFSDNNSNGITAAVVSAAGRGVTVRLIVAGGSSSATQTTALNEVKSAGGTVFVSDASSGGGTATDPYIHAKAILVDCATGACTSGFVGSENMTTGSLLYNREVGVIITDKTQLGLIYTAMSSDFSNPKDTKL